MVFQYRHGDKPLEGYSILRGIGRGGFGEVYYAQSDSGREVALKVIHQNHDIELRGVRHCMNLKSPHLISIFDVRRNADGLPFVIMEYVSGPSLRDLLRDSPAGVGRERAAFLVREIARGLSYLHDRGIVHRDLKPENIFYEDGYVKIGDYGLSKYISVSRQSGQSISVGTVHYMAPEIGSGNYHRGIDIYSLGVIFYELLTGNVPFNGDSMGEILMKHLTHEPDVAAIEPQFQPVVRKALAKNPSNRYADAAAMVGDMFSDAELTAQVAALNLSSFASKAPPPPVPDLQGPALEAQPTQVAPRPERPPPPVTRPAAAADPGAFRLPLPEAGAPPLAALRQAPHFKQRLIMGLGVASLSALALGLGRVARGSDNPEWILACGAIIGVCAVGPFLLEHWANRRFFLDTSWFGQRFFTLLATGPLLVLIASSDQSLSNSTVQLLLSMALINWRDRTRTNRSEQISLGSTITAALCGFIISVMVPHSSWQLAAGMMASISLTLNAISPFEPKRRKMPGPGQPPYDAGAGRFHPPPAPFQAGGHPGAAELDAFLRNAPPGRAPVPPQVIRPRSGRIFAGVCAGFASYHHISPIWMRLLMVALTLLFLIGPLIYLVLWICIPGEEKLQAPGPPRNRRPWQIALKLSGALLLFLGLLFFSLVGVRTGGSLGISNNAPAWGIAMPAMFLIGGGAIASLLAAGIQRRRRADLPDASAPPPRREPERGGQPSAGMAWAIAGGFLIALSIICGYAGGILDSPAGEEILLNVGIRRFPELLEFSHGRGHLLVSLAAYIAGVFCLLAGRRSGGAMHVLRGAFGWTVAGIFLGYFALRLPGMVEASSRSLLPFTFHYHLAGDELMSILIFGIFTVLCLAWPGKAIT